jgi:hypothetical protein
MNFLVDSGAQNSLIQPGVHCGNIVPPIATTVGVTGDMTRWRGVQELHFVIDGNVYQHSFGIMPLPSNIDGLLGMDFLTKTQATINMSKGVIKMLKGWKKIRNPPCGGPNSEGVGRQGWTRRKHKKRRYENSGPEDWDKEVDLSPTTDQGSSLTSLSRKNRVPVKCDVTTRSRSQPPQNYSKQSHEEVYSTCMFKGTWGSSYSCTQKPERSAVSLTRGERQGKAVR